MGDGGGGGVLTMQCCFSYTETSYLPDSQNLTKLKKVEQKFGVKNKYLLSDLGIFPYFQIPCIQFQVT